MSSNPSSGSQERGPVTGVPKEIETTLLELDRVREDGGSFLRGLVSGQWGWRPARDRWSVGECIAHVNETNRVYLPAIESAARSARERGLLGQGPFKHGFLGEWMIRELEPPAKRRFKAPRRFVPPVGETGPQALGEFDDLLRKYAGLLLSMNGLDLGRAQVVSPANRFLRLSLGQAFRVIAAHTRRHLWQARRIAQEEGFPQSPVAR